MRRIDPEAGNAGLTVVEMVIAVALVVTLSVLAAAHMTMLGDETSSLATEMDMDEEGRFVLNGLRRELRQSGWDESGILRLSSPAAEGSPSNTLSFQHKLGNGPTDWSTTVTYQLTSNGESLNDGSTTIPLFQLERVQDGETVPLAQDVSAFWAEREGATVLVTLELARRDGPNVVTRKFEDRIAMLNPQLP